MSLSYTWEFVSANEGLLVGIIHTVTWRCTATDDDGNTATIDGSTVFDDVAVLQNQPEPLTGTRLLFLKTLRTHNAYSGLLMYTMLLIFVYQR